MNVQAAALQQCANVDNGGVISACPVLARYQDPYYSYNCPQRAPLINESTTGMLSKLPGCNNVTPGPAKPLASDNGCPANATLPEVGATPTLLVPARVVSPIPGYTMGMMFSLFCITLS